MKGKPITGRITYDLSTRSRADPRQAQPRNDFLIYVSGMGTDANSRTMWARVKGETENALLSQLPFKAAYMFSARLHLNLCTGSNQKPRCTESCMRLWGLSIPCSSNFFPNTRRPPRCWGRAMIKAARAGAPKKIWLESQDINAL